MRFSNWFKAFEWTTVKFGEGDLRRFVLIEIKYLFSIYINIWNVIAHDRFHTHAFPSISFFLRGWYHEEQLEWQRQTPPGERLQIEAAVVKKHFYRAPFVRFISRTNNHRMLLSSPNAITVTLAGPWDRMWSETDVAKLGTRVLSWGRKVVARDNTAPTGH